MTSRCIGRFYQLVDLKMEKAKKIFVNILFYISLVAFSIPVLSPLIVIIRDNPITTTLFFVSLSLWFLSFVFSIIPFLERKHETLKLWQNKTINIVFLLSLGFSLSLILSLFLTVISSVTFSINNLPLILIPIPLFITSLIISIIPREKGWIYGLIVSTIYLVFMTTLAYLMGEAVQPELTFIGHLLELFSFPGTTVRYALIMLGGLAGGLIGEFVRVLIDNIIKKCKK